jgi:hypothetical protein
MVYSQIVILRIALSWYIYINRILSLVLSSGSCGLDRGCVTRNRPGDPRVNITGSVFLGNGFLEFYQIGRDQTLINQQMKDVLVITCPFCGTVTLFQMI